MPSMLNTKRTRQHDFDDLVSAIVADLKSGNTSASRNTSARGGSWTNSEYQTAHRQAQDKIAAEKARENEAKRVQVADTSATMNTLLHQQYQERSTRRTLVVKDEITPTGKLLREMVDELKAKG